MSVFPVNEPFKFEGELKENALQGVINAVKSQTDINNLTPRDIGEMLALGGIGPRPIGTPDMVADELMKWVEGDLDGFNLSGKNTCQENRAMKLRTNKKTSCGQPGKLARRGRIACA